MTIFQVFLNISQFYETALSYLYKDYTTPNDLTYNCDVTSGNILAFTKKYHETQHIKISRTETTSKKSPVLEREYK